MYTELDSDIQYIYIWRIITNTKWRAAQSACAGEYFSNTQSGKLILMCTLKKQDVRITKYVISKKLRTEIFDNFYI